MKRVKRVLAMCIAFAMLLSFGAVPVAAEEPTKPTMQFVASQLPGDSYLGESGFILTMQATTCENIQTAYAALEFDSSVVLPYAMTDETTPAPTGALNTSAITTTSWTDRNAWAKQVSNGYTEDFTQIIFGAPTVRFRKNENDPDYYYMTVEVTKAGGGSFDSSSGYLNVANMAFKFVDGKSIGDLSDNTIKMGFSDLTLDDIRLSYALKFIAAVNNGSNSWTAFRATQTADAGSNISDTMDQPQIVFPRSTAESPVTLKENDTVTVDAESGKITLAAPEKDTTYTADAALALAEVTGLDQVVTPNETATFEAKNILEADGVTFVIDAAGNVTTNGPVPGSFREAEATITVNVTGGNGTYTKDIKVTIPDATLPAHKLTPAGGSVKDKTPNWTVADVMTKFMTGDNAGWELLTDTNKPEGCTYVPMNGANTLTVSGGVAADGTATTDGVYFIPVFKDAVADEYRATAALFQVKIVPVPVSGSWSRGRYVPTTTTLKFEEALNTEWEYAVVEKAVYDAAAPAVTPFSLEEGTPAAQDAASDLLDGLTYQTGTENGVTFTGLKPGTQYYLAARAKAADGEPASAADIDTDPAITDYDLEVVSSWLTKDPDKVSTLDKTGTEPVVRALTSGSVTAENAENYQQEITLRNTNGSTIYNVAANVYTDATGTTPSDKYTVTVQGDPSSVAANDEIVIRVTPTDKVVRGTSNQAVVIVTAENAASGGTQVVRKPIMVTMTVYGNRDGNAVVSDTVLRPATLVTADTTVAKATANSAVKLSAVWGTETASGYALKTSGSEEGEAVTAVLTGAEVTAKGITADTAGNAIDADAYYLVLNKDVNTLGTLATVTATFAQDDTEYYVAETADIKINVKAGAQDTFTDDEGNPVAPAIQDEYVLVVPAEQNIELDLTGGITGATVTETAPVTSAAVLGTDGTLTIPANDNTTGTGTYTVTIAANDEYDEATIPVTVYTMTGRTMGALTDIDKVTGTDDGAKVYLPKEVTLDGTAYNGTLNYEIIAGQSSLNGELQSDAEGTFVTLANPLTKADKVQVKVSVPADKTQHIAGAEAVQAIVIREPAELTGTLVYNVKGDTDNVPDVTSISLDITGADAVDYALIEGIGIVTLSGGTVTVVNPIARYGKAVIRATSEQTDTQTAGSVDIEVFVRQPADPDGGSPDIDMGDPTNGTGAVIVGKKWDATDAEYNYEFDGDMDEDGTKDSWLTDSEGVQFRNLKPGVKYEVRFMLADGTDVWYGGNEWAGTTVPPDAAGNVDGDGWWTFSTLGGEDGAPSSGIFTMVPSAGNLRAAQIRYKNDGTVGDTTTDPVDDNNWIIHGLNPNVNYQYRVQKADTSWETIADVTTDAGWRDLPMADAVDDTKTGNDGLKMYTVTRDFVIANVETRYVSDPTITKDEPEEGDYIIKGLVPHANYDLAPGQDGEGNPNSFKEDPVNYIVRRADENGWIVIKKDSTEKTFLGEPPYIIRMSKTDSTEPGGEVIINAGVEVSGTVTAYAPKNPVRLELCRMSDFNGEFTSPLTVQDVAELSRTDVEAVFVTEIEGKESGTGQFTDAFKFTGVTEGTYLLRVKKTGHATVYVANIQVGATAVAIDMSAVYGNGTSAVNMLPGDLDGDGVIDLIDAGILYGAQTYNVNMNNGGVPDAPAADLDGDGVIDLVDGGLLYSTASYNKAVIDNTFVYSIPQE